MRQRMLEEEYVRLTAPEHEMETHFSMHQEIEETFENHHVSEFSGCDRLIKFESPFGVIQFGYYPAYRMSFLYASAKKSVYDSGFSYQNQEREGFQQLSRIPGLLRYSAGRSSIIYRPAGVLWSIHSMEPILRRTEALSKTFPFFSAEKDIHLRKQLMEERRTNQQYLMDSYRKNNSNTSAMFRQRDNAFLAQQNYLNSLIIRKQSKSLNFFQKLNRSFEDQKQEIVEYYQTKYAGLPSISLNNQAPLTETEEGNDDHEQDERIQDNQRV